ncbi:formate--tetrahydrofolate ligase [Salibacter sp.]|uniref:formate--tetrahydrofolate ligase n=1 Tax=Salibacter sp. TaxID=2010995 RepID=UPI0028704CB0|nr:formate--tetrahydrofolate ligase [Salibacter sp.]MDR9398227.1 formate--tetrahydrofolate ligase [Salibacter sp.]MDR9487469.1 formate--tetrahydrofolate ligase [Salibacter sp.]
MKSDIEIANSVEAKNISEIAEKLGIGQSQIEPYGHHKAKLPLSLIDDEKAKQSKLVLVTSINPTPSGEGKTTSAIGLNDGLNLIGKKSTVVLREPSLGPVFGIKGGAAGGGMSQVIPMEDINLHFTGDFAAIEKANNLLAAIIDNDVQKKDGGLGIDPRTVTWKRCMDMNDRALRNIVSGLGGKAGGFPTETGFNITAASEIMAILCMSNTFADLKEKLGNIYIGDTRKGEPVFAKDLKAENAMAILLKDAIKPNLVQTLEGNPAIIHGGPFANIAQGTNSIIATKTGLSLSDYVITEAGFGADLGAEKFFNIKSRHAGVSPSAVVIVATIRALKYHGGAKLDNLTEPDFEALTEGLKNLQKHIQTIQSFGIKPIVAINKFVADQDSEINKVCEFCENEEVKAVLADSWGKGGEGNRELANEVVTLCDENPSTFNPLYNLDDDIESKINKIAKVVYGAGDVKLSAKAQKQMNRFEKLGFDKLPVCIAKTQKSLSDDASLIGRPSNFTFNVREFEIAAGAGFVIPIAGNMLRMPGLPSTPAAEKMEIDGEGNISGLS